MNLCIVYYIVVSGIVRYVGSGGHSRIRFHRYSLKKYIKGTGRHHTSLYQPLSSAFLAGETIEYRVVLAGLTKEQAAEQELLQIESFPEGQLWNLSKEQRAALHSDPEVRARRLAGIQKKYSDPEYRAKMSQHRSSMMLDPEVQTKRVATQEKSPGWLAHLARLRSPEYQAHLVRLRAPRRTPT